MGDSPHVQDTLADGSANPRAGELTVYGDTWAKGLAGLSGEQLACGLGACLTRTDVWPPVLAEFRALCLGIPSFGQVRDDMARANADRSPFTIMVGRHIDGCRYRLADTREAERMLREAYGEAREAVMRGEPLPEPLPQLKADEKPVFVPASPETARAHLAKIAAALGRPPAEGQAAADA